MRAIPTLPTLVVPLAAVVYLSGCSSGVIIDGDPIVRVLRKDAIRSIDRPKMITVTEADALMADEAPVLGVFDGKEARAYSLWHLDVHEIVNDTLGDLPIAATW